MGRTNNLIRTWRPSWNGETYCYDKKLVKSLVETLRLKDHKDRLITESNPNDQYDPFFNHPGLYMIAGAKAENVPKVIYALYNHQKEMKKPYNFSFQFDNKGEVAAVIQTPKTEEYHPFK